MKNKIKAFETLISPKTPALTPASPALGHPAPLETLSGPGKRRRRQIFHTSQVAGPSNRQNTHCSQLPHVREYERGCANYHESASSSPPAARHNSTSDETGQHLERYLQTASASLDNSIRRYNEIRHLISKLTSDAEDERLPLLDEFIETLSPEGASRRPARYTVKAN